MKRFIVIAFNLLLLIGLASPVLAQALPQDQPDGAVTQKQAESPVAEEEQANFTPPPFEPDLGYNEIYNNLPQSRYEGIALEELGLSFLNTLQALIAILALIGIIYSGIMFITAGGDADKAAKARNNIIWILTGIIVYMLIFVFVPYIRLFLETGLDPTQRSFIPPGQQTGITAPPNDPNLFQLWLYQLFNIGGAFNGQ